MNQRKVPQLFVATGATKWITRNFPWTMGWQPDDQSEAKIYAEHILETAPNAKIAVLYQNDDYGKDYLKGFEDGLGAKAKTMIVSKQSYEVTDPTIDSQMNSLKASGADTFSTSLRQSLLRRPSKRLPKSVGSRTITSIRFLPQ
jgi:branched-chain amino acid transport system substrate-binding protein